MASITKRGKTYTANVSLMTEQGRKRSTKSGFKTKVEAQVWATKQETKKYEGKLVVAINVGIADFYLDWYKAFKEQGLNEWTKVWYMRTYKILLNDFNNKPINKVTTIEFQEFLNEYAKNHVQKTVNKFKSHVRQMINYGISENLIEKDFTFNTKVIGAKKLSKIKYLETDEINGLISVLDFKNQSDQYIYIALMTGLRYAEVAGLSSKDLNGDMLTVERNWNELTKSYKSTKTESSNRVIKVDSTIQGLLSNFDNSLPISSNAANKRLRQLLKEIDAQSITFHGLRHTHASYLLANGVNIQYVSERLGHKDSTVTLNTYAHLLDSKRKKDEIETLEYLSKIGVKATKWLQSN